MGGRHKQINHEISLEIYMDELDNHRRKSLEAVLYNFVVITFDHEDGVHEIDICRLFWTVNWGRIPLKKFMKVLEEGGKKLAAEDGETPE
ncbi:type II toxin-antitoxin system VapC family toxin [Formicincola oecophyllae]|uniref:Type II toxin-antitoxin system VapC family toxin n=1 Tax=Formicincola oecophyllae TaxID=2558361 RepID=A0A4Y6UC95_9PROT|nr:type II toxin-antitoxin system VapC family toxin [Formicincola oecophyllae]QDH14106.1 type II toxin-antitoxin system VapC family toxin [Formicincola oecophyllae]